MGILDLFKKKEESIPDFNFDNNTAAGLNPMPQGFDTNLGLEPHQEFNDSGMQAMNANTLHTPAMNPQSTSPAANLSTMGMQSQQNYAQYPQTTPGPDIAKDLQILSLKLDAIKSELDSVNQRVATIERIALKDEQQMQQKRWY